MDYSNFLGAVSAERFSRYLSACGGNKAKAIMLYRLNQRLSREMFSIVSCLEVGLRNKVDSILSVSLGPDWLRDSILPGDIFDKPSTQKTKKIIDKVYQEIISKGHYVPSKLLSKMEFGIWKYMYAGPQYTSTSTLSDFLYYSQLQEEICYHRILGIWVKILKGYLTVSERYVPVHNLHFVCPNRKC